MNEKRYVVMGAGEVGRHLALSLARDGHLVTVIDSDPDKRRLVEEQLEARFVLGNGSHVPTLEAAEVAGCELFVAASSSDEANLAASLLAKQEGAPRTVVRVATAEDVTRYGRRYEQAFEADLLLSTQLLTTTQILNRVLGINTHEIEYLAGGSLEVRRTGIEPGSMLAEKRLAEADLPKDCLVLALLSDGRVNIATGDTRATAGDDVIVIGTSDALDEFEGCVSRAPRRLGLVVVAGGGATAESVIRGLGSRTRHLKLIEAERERAEQLAAEFPQHDIVHGDVTDMSLQASEGTGNANAFIALTGNDETNLMACLLAQELGAKQLTALVQKSDTSTLWRKVALLDVVSPRTVAAERIRQYIDCNFEPHIVSFEHGAAEFIQRTVHPASPAAGQQLADIEIPEGLLVAAILRDSRTLIPHGDVRIEVGDAVVLFVRSEEAGMAQLIFPGQDRDPAIP